MAVKHSKKLVEESFERAYHVPNIQNELLKKTIKISNIFILKKTRRLFFLIKKLYVNIHVFLKTCFKKKILLTINPSINKKNYKDIFKELDNKGWVFIENFMEINFYNLLLKNWPSNLYFKYRNNPIKNYLWGFEYLNKGEGGYYLDSDDKKLILFDELSAYYNYILSEDFKRFIKEINPERYNFQCVSINATSAKKNAFLIPHIDSISEEENSQYTLNCIHFIDGNNDDIEYSGGTGIFKDNEFKEKIFIPTTLKNSLLIYNSKLNFFHGFKKMKKNSYRKAIAFQFFSK